MDGNRRDVLYALAKDAIRSGNTVDSWLRYLRNHHMITLDEIEDEVDCEVWDEAWKEVKGL